eukprot:CAMPEP_0184693448 /NCGR_PEP_ID=MMETSP0313-20130426/1669_1 /TAXON_ID=2792 /ORGANISM="Porphyridium aerugineum, Strain SAG 1380-2" /LENGTH=440 /DNA_ID=CAMNT_0027151531 /DNA_START=135 /DNA_END=1457 /DNA_ORIENTATION=-
MSSANGTDQVLISKPSWGTRFLKAATNSLTSSTSTSRAMSRTESQNKIASNGTSSPNLQKLGLDSSPSDDDDATDSIWVTRHEMALATGGMGCDEALLAQQRALAYDVVKQIGMNVLRGKDLLNVTFPINIAEPKSALQKFASSCVYAPYLLQKAAQMKENPVERLKYVIAFYVSGFHATSGIRKPLNPLLGETLQLDFLSGNDAIDKNTESSNAACALYMEQTSHHPPVSNWILRGPGYEYHGHMTYSARFGLNEVKLIHSGDRSVDFDDGTSIRFGNPYDTFSGVLWGKYTHNTYGNVEFSDAKNGLFCELKFGGSKGELSDYFQGSIVRKRTVDGQEQSEIVDTVYGSWLAYMKSAQGGEFTELGANGSPSRIYWSLFRDKPSRFETPAKVLPSDSSKRADLVAMLAGNMDLAQEMKGQLEDRQRGDRKLRLSKISS